MLPEKVPTEDYIEGLWKSVKAGLITWKDVGKLQAEAMPTCEAHNQPANVKIGRVPLCAQCIEERRHVQR